MQNSLLLFTVNTLNYIRVIQCQPPSRPIEFLGGKNPVLFMSVIGLALNTVSEHSTLSMF